MKIVRGPDYKVYICIGSTIYDRICVSSRTGDTRRHAYAQGQAARSCPQAGLAVRLLMLDLDTSKAVAGTEARVDIL